MPPGKRGLSDSHVRWTTCIEILTCSLDGSTALIEEGMAKGFRISEAEYEALRKRNGSRGVAADQQRSSLVLPEALTLAPPPKPEDRMLALGRLPDGVMNKTESDYGTVLEMERRAGAITWFGFEPIKLRLGKNAFYTPDYGALLACGVLELREVKGYWREDARVKIKAAAHIYPFFRFVAVTKIPLRAGGGWRREEF
ncbi:TPA: hypothetical protein ACK3Q6_006538 [Burkholderia cepacia]|jgi:hypothetical protein|nr:MULTISPECIES: hypothetical protein [Burkholderia]MCA7881145.1 hypothetical protein [Burkholderia contaminans]MCA7910867.1 hypothetical protein [Burkholderia contaminans]MCA8363487.1 hypothetical protein [Burkholderia cepacia]MDK0996848.1 hypothetical protein [Burkholderia contaminans]